MASWNAAGIFNTSFNPATLNQDSFAGFIVANYPPGAKPLFAMSTMFGPVDRPVVNAEHGYHTETFLFASVKINHAAYAAGDTTLVVDSTAGVVAGMCFQVPATRENIRVTSVDSATQLTVSRKWGRVAAGAIADDAVLFSVGSSFAEESTRPTARSISAVYVPNYTSIFRNAWGISNTAKASKTTLSQYNNLTRRKEQCVDFHTLNWEEVAIWSQPQAPAGTPLMHSTQGLVDGIYNHASGNIFTAGATTTYAQFEAYMAAAFASTNSRSNSNTRVALCDRQALRVADHIGKLYPHDVQVTSGETSFGTAYTKMRFYAGTVTFVEDQVLNGAGNAKGLMLVIDPSVLNVGYLGGRDAIAEDTDGSGDSIGNALDATQGGLLTEMVFMNYAPGSHVIINGLTDAAAS